MTSFPFILTRILDIYLFLMYNRLHHKEYTTKEDLILNFKLQKPDTLLEAQQAKKG